MRRDNNHSGLNSLLTAWSASKQNVKSSIICNSSVATGRTTTANPANTNENVAGPSATCIKYTSSHTVTSTEMLTKRKIDASDRSSNAEPMAKRTKRSMDAPKVAVAVDEADESPSNGMCMVCVTEPKDGAFVHRRLLHVCCCYHCAFKIWNKRKRCPICKVPVKAVLKMFVHWTNDPHFDLIPFCIEFRYFFLWVDLTIFYLIQAHLTWF